MQPRRVRLLMALVLVCLVFVAGVAGSAAGMRSAGPSAAAPDAMGLAQTLAAAYSPPGEVATPVPQVAERPASRTYTVRSGDTLSDIAARFAISTTTLIEANKLANPDNLTIGQRLTVPGMGPAGDESIEVAAAAAPAPRAGPIARLPERARSIGPDSPMYRTTWVTYYGRPEVPVMGILGEYSLDDLIPTLRRQARAYDEANGPGLGVTPTLIVYQLRKPC